LSAAVALAVAVVVVFAVAFAVFVRHENSGKRPSCNLTSRVNKNGTSE
jgi:hypothetical protein